MKNPKVSKRELSQLDGISEDGVKFQLDKLKREDIKPGKTNNWNFKRIEIVLSDLLQNPLHLNLYNCFS